MSQDPHRPKVAVETARPFRELFDALEQAGFETEHRPPLEQRSAGPVAGALAIYLLEKLAEPDIENAVAVVRAWVASWFLPFLRRKESSLTVTSIPIYGPDGEVLSRVKVNLDDD